MLWGQELLDSLFVSTRVHPRLLVASVLLRTHGFTPGYWWRLCCCEHTVSLPVIDGVCVATSTRFHSRLLVASVLLRAHGFTLGYWWRLCCCEHTSSPLIIGGVCVAANTRVHSQLLVASVLLRAHEFTPDYWWRLCCCEHTALIFHPIWSRAHCSRAVLWHIVSSGRFIGLLARNLALLRRLLTVRLILKIILSIYKCIYN